MTNEDIEREAIRQQAHGPSEMLGHVFETKTICANSPIPEGWIKVGDRWNPTMCGKPTTIVFNVWTIQRYDNLPVDSRLTVCAAAPTPSGWVDVSTSWNPTMCGNPNEEVENVKVIQRVE